MTSRAARTHPPATPLPAARSGQVRNVVILASSQALYLITAITVMTLGGVVGQRLAPSPTLATLPVAAMMLGAVLTTLPASLLMRRIGRRAGFLIGASFGGVVGGGLAVVGVSTGSFWLFTVGGLFLGGYQAFAMYYRFAAAEAANDAFRSRAISLVLAGGVVAAFLGPWNATFGQGLVPTEPELGPFIVITALAVLATILVGFLRIPGTPAEHAGPRRPMHEVAAQPMFVVAVSTAAVSYAAMILVMTAAPLAMLTAGFTMTNVAFVMQWHVLGMFAPSFVTGHLISRYGVLRIIFVGALVFLVAAIAAMSGTSIVHYFLSLLLVGVGWNFMFIGSSSLLTHTHTPAERGAVQGVNDLVVFSLVALGSLLAGALMHTVGWVALNLLVLPFVVLAALGAAYLARTPGTLERT